MRPREHFPCSSRPILALISTSFVAVLIFVNTFGLSKLLGDECWFSQCDCIQATAVKEESSLVSKEHSQHIWTQVTFSVDFEKEIVSHKMQYLQDIGLDMGNALISIHQQNITKDMQETVDRVASFGVPFSQIHTWDGVFDNDRKYKQRLAARAEVDIDQCDWIINLDGDEFPRAPGNDIVSFLETLGYQGFDSVNSYWMDRFGPNGTLPNVTEIPALSQQFPIACRDFTDSVAGSPTFKLFAFRGYLNECKGGSHTLMDGSTACQYPFHIHMDHYKWNWKVLDKLRRRAIQYKLLGHKWYTSSLRFLDHLEHYNGSANIDDSRFECREASNLMALPVLDETTTMKSHKERSNWQTRMKQNLTKFSACGMQHMVCPSQLFRAQPL